MGGVWGAQVSATKILWGQVLAVSLIVFAAIWAATQWTAWRLGYQPQLGEPWIQFASLRLYPPAFFLWWFWFDAYAPRIFVEGAAIASSGGFAAIAIAIGMSVWRAHEAKEAVTYGSARWASAREVQSAGLLGADGVVLGRFGRNYLRHDGPEHVLCFAPTRSGKGIGLVVPTLLTWPGSAIVHDIKGKTGASPPAGARGSAAFSCSTQPTRTAGPTIRCSKFGAAMPRCATCRTSPIFWSIRKERSMTAPDRGLCVPLGGDCEDHRL